MASRETRPAACRLLRCRGVKADRRWLGPGLPRAGSQTHREDRADDSGPGYGPVLPGQRSGAFPPQFLFLDIDRVYNEDVIDAEKALETWERSLARNLEIGEKLAGLLTAAPA